ncbi:MAG: WYL domain-containing protein, partial [Muribaculaceae bacterium]|nr:WYL domain-containing protein [Muribaculaceae bacterium]
MAKDLLNRYIWIIDTIRRYGRISRRELDECWRRSPFSNGDIAIPRRTFFNYRHAIEELFSLTIECDPSTYEYYITDHGQGEMTEWLLNSSSTSNVLQGARDVAERIMLEDVPSARDFLAPIIEALRLNQSITFDYHPHTRSKPTPGVTLEPYFLRIHRQLWYVTGRNTADSRVKTYSLDRMAALRLNPDRVTPPPDAGGVYPAPGPRDEAGGRGRGWGGKKTGGGGG